jgi:hypothetical protein
MKTQTNLKAGDTTSTTTTTATTPPRDVASGLPTGKRQWKPL